MLQKVADVLVHLRNFGLLLQKLRYWCVAASKGAQGCFVVWVRQHAHVKYIVCIGGYAAFEGKRFKYNGELLARDGQ